MIVARGKANAFGNATGSGQPHSRSVGAAGSGSDAGRTPQPRRLSRAADQHRARSGRVEAGGLAASELGADEDLPQDPLLTRGAD